MCYCVLWQGMSFVQQVELLSSRHLAASTEGSKSGTDAEQSKPHTLTVISEQYQDSSLTLIQACIPPDALLSDMILWTKEDGIPHIALYCECSCTVNAGVL